MYSTMYTPQFHTMRHVYTTIHTPCTHDYSKLHAHTTTHHITCNHHHTLYYNEPHTILHQAAHHTPHTHTPHTIQQTGSANEIILLQPDGQTPGETDPRLAATLAALEGLAGGVLTEQNVVVQAALGEQAPFFAAGIWVWSEGVRG